MTNYARARYRGVRSAKPAKTRAAHATPTPGEDGQVRTPWRRPRRANGKPFAHGAAARRDAAGLPAVTR